MVLHKVSACRDRTWDRTVQQTFRDITNVPESRDLWPRPWPWAHPGCRPGWGPSCASLVVFQPCACEKWFSWNHKCSYHVTFDLDIDLEHNLDAGSSVDHCVQVWWRSSHLPTRRSDIREITKVSLSRDLWPWPWAQPGCGLFWGPSCASLAAIQPFLW